MNPVLLSVFRQNQRMGLVFKAKKVSTNITWLFCCKYDSRCPTIICSDVFATRPRNKKSFPYYYLFRCSLIFLLLFIWSKKNHSKIEYLFFFCSQIYFLNKHSLSYNIIIEHQFKKVDSSKKLGIQKLRAGAIFSYIYTTFWILFFSEFTSSRTKSIRDILFT